MKWVVRHERWGILHIELDKTWQDLVNELDDAGKSSSEAAAIGRLRAMASGQETFAAVAGGGYAGDLRCLLKPAACGIESTVGFVDDSFQDAERSGYRFTLHAGPALRLEAGGSTILKNYAYTAEPITAGVYGAPIVLQRRQGHPVRARRRQAVRDRERGVPRVVQPAEVGRDHTSSRNASAGSPGPVKRLAGREER